MSHPSSSASLGGTIPPGWAASRSPIVLSPAWVAGRFPTATAAPPRDGVDSASALRPLKSGDCLLVVEDNPADVALVREALREADAQHRVVSVARLSEAIEYLERPGAMPAAALLDLGLPDASGLEALERVRRDHPLLPIVVLTGHADTETAVRALENGAEDYLDKSSLDGEVLIRSLKYAVARVRWRSQLLEIVERNSDAMAVLDRRGTVLMVNAAAEELFGVPRTELIGTELGTPVAPDSGAEIEVHTHHGPRALSMRTAQIEWNGRAAYLTSMRDITESKRAEEIERRLAHADRLASIGQLAAGVAHEVNNPSAAVTVNLSLMKERFMAARIAGNVALLDPEWLEGLATECIDAMDRIRRIVNDLRTFARVDDDDVEMVNLNDVVVAACNIVEVQIKHSARLVKSFGEVPLIAGSASRLGQVAVNLLMNAAQAIDAGADTRHEIRIVTRAIGDGVELCVEDTGTGIDPAHLNRIFEPFFTTKPREIGTGLGLPLCRSIVESHGGRITVYPKERGTRFVVYLPRRAGLPVSRPAEEGPRSRPPPAARRARVLIVDDEPTLLRAFRRVLGGHDVVTACGGPEGLAVLSRDQDFDLVLCDLAMPELDGPALYEASKSIAPSLADRFVFISGGGSFTPGIRSFVQTTAAEVIAKPVDPERLRRIVGRRGREEPR